MSYELLLCFVFVSSCPGCFDLCIITRSDILVYARRSTVVLPMMHESSQVRSAELSRASWTNEHTTLCSMWERDVLDA